MKEYKVDRKGFNYFRQRCMHWAKILSISHFEFFFQFGDTPDDVRADIGIDLVGKICTIRLNSEWTSPVTKVQLDRVAFHEILELLLADLAFYAYISASRGLVEEVTHKIIRSLENYVFKSASVVEIKTNITKGKKRK